MMSRNEFLALGAALTAGAGGAAQSPRTATELEAAAREGTPHKAATIMGMGQAGLLKLLTDQNSSEFEKAKACQRLAVVGDEKAVPAMAALLPDHKLSHYARIGLEQIPGPAADAALREALTSLTGNLLIGVINSAGRRRDAKALDALAKLLHDPDESVALASAAAVAQIRRP